MNRPGKRLKRILWLLLPGGGMMPSLGCSLQDRPGPVWDLAVEDLPILASYVGAFSGLKREVRLAVYDQRMLDQLPLQTRPVDFSREMVLFAGMGLAPSGRYSIEITRVERVGRRVHAHVVKTYPSTEQGVEAGLASPFCAVIVPRSELPVERFDGRWPLNAFRQVRPPGL